MHTAAVEWVADMTGERGTPQLSGKPRPLPLMLAVFLAVMLGSENAQVLPNQNLTIPNIIYTLSSPRISPNSINITANNITIDCRGNWIVGGNRTNTYAILSLGNGTVLKNCNIRDFWGGVRSEKSIFIMGGQHFTGNNSIYLGEDADGSRISDLFIDPPVCLQLNGTDYSNLANITCNEATQYGFYLRNNSVSNNFTNFSISALETSLGVYGVYLESGSTDNIFDCKGRAINVSYSLAVPEIFTPAVYIGAANNLIKNCIIENFTRASDVYEKGNVFVNITYYNRGGYGDLHGGIGCYASDCQVYNSTFNLSGADPEFGIQLVYADYSIIEGNQIYGIDTAHGHGIEIVSSYIATIRNNKISTTSTANAIYAQDTTDNSIMNNSLITIGGKGIYLIFAQTSTIEGNNISTQTGEAILEESSSSNIYRSNRLASLNGTLFRADGGGDIFILNNFTNTSGVYVNSTGIHIFNSTEGNMWANVINNSVNISGTVNSSISGLYVGAFGVGYPYNQTTSQGKFLCPSGCADFAPLTKNWVNCTSTLEYSQTMTPDFLIISRPSSPSWIIHFLNFTTPNQACILNTTARVYAANTSELLASGYYGGVSTSINTSGIVIPRTIKTNVTFIGRANNGSTSTRTFAMILTPASLPANKSERSWFPNLTYLIIFIGVVLALSWRWSK